MEYSKMVSILVPVYNVEKYLNRCIDSILSQTYKDFELILVDDCSEDNSLLICNEYAQKDNRIKVIKKPNHTNLSDVRNVGVENASGKYLMFVDSDDYVGEDFVEKMVNAIEEKDVDVVKCKGIWYINDDSNYIETFRGNENKLFRDEKIKEVLPYFEARISYNTWSLIIKKSSLKVKFDTNVYGIEDKVFIIDLMLSISSIYFLDEALYHYCANDTGITKSKDNYFKVVNGILSGNEIIKKKLIEKNLLTEENEREINSTYFINVFLKTYTILDNNCIKIHGYMKDVFEKEEFRKAINNVNISMFGVRQRIKYVLAKYRLYVLLTIFLKIDYQYVKIRKIIW